MPKRNQPRSLKEPRATTPAPVHPAAAAGAFAHESSWSAALNSRRLHAIAVPGLLAITAGLAIASLVGDSVTFDETSHLPAGMSYLQTGDFRLAPDHPPLAKMWAALPLLLVDHRWPAPDDSSWQLARHYDFGKQWLFKQNHPDRLIIPARLMMVLLLLATCLTIYALARTLFGPPAALLALLLAAFSPTLLAHGRLVTTDMPVALAAALVLLTFARLLQRMDWPRLLAAAGAVAMLTLVKFSWPVVLIGPGVMIVLALARNAPLESRLLRHAPRGTEEVHLLRTRRARAGGIALACLFMAAAAWAAIWTCYGWRFEMIPSAPPAASPLIVEDNAAMAKSRRADWRTMLNEPGGALKRARLTLSEWVRFHRLLPEAYLYGFNNAMRSAEARDTYFMGQHSHVGRPAYFPLAFAIKTPIANILLVAAGILAVICKPDLRRRDPILLCGLAAFGAAYTAAALTSKINIGHRHLLPLYPLLFVLGGAAVAWLSRPRLRWAIPGACVWLCGATLWIHPHYLAYFNELIGGPANGHKYLLDSNIDWGQDLKRLAQYAQQHADQPLKLAYFGTADPAAYGIQCTALPSLRQYDAAPAELTGGVYACSVNQLFGLSQPKVRDEFWADPQVQRRYHELIAAAAAPPPGESSDALQEWQGMREDYDRARRWRLLNQLRHLRPDDRVGYSLFIYNLTQSQVDELTRL